MHSEGPADPGDPDQPLVTPDGDHPFVRRPAKFRDLAVDLHLPAAAGVAADVPEIHEAAFASAGQPMAATLIGQGGDVLYIRDWHTQRYFTVLSDHRECA